MMSSEAPLYPVVTFEVFVNDSKAHFIVWKKVFIELQQRGIFG